MSDEESACFACRNMDAYWQERAKHDPELRKRLLELERASNPLAKGSGSTSADDCPPECLEAGEGDQSQRPA